TFTPYQVSVRGVGQPSGDCLIDACTRAEEPVNSAFPGDERPLVLIDIASDEVRGVGIRTSHEQCGHVHDVCGETCCDQFRDCFSSRHKNLTAHVTALFDGC